MLSFESRLQDLGEVSFPTFTGLRVMMMPIIFDDPDSIPRLEGYDDVILDLLKRIDPHHGVGYVTIDEALVEESKTHRRPGLHVDGVAEVLSEHQVAIPGSGGYSGGGWGGARTMGSWGGGSSAPVKYETQEMRTRENAASGGDLRGGMILAASVAGCIGWTGTFQGAPKANGDCEHLRDQAPANKSILLHSNRAYWANSMFLHQTFATPFRHRRQFIRLSTPNPYPWYEGYTPNPLGVEPAGPILPRREFMNYRTKP